MKKIAKKIINSSSTPIIVVGMHRSGTSILTNLLEKCGIFMGHKKDGHHESLVFKGLNVDSLDIMGYGWRSLAAFPSTDEPDCLTEVPES